MSQDPQQPASLQQQKTSLQLLAGIDSNEKPVLENVEAYVLEKDHHYELIKSPLFLRNLAAGDIFYFNPEESTDIKILQRSGKLCIRVYRKENIEALELRLTPEVEKLDGSLDIQTPRALAYSLHVNNGFAVVEGLFDGMMAEFTDSVWYYGNIYDPADGSTPINWWDEFLNTV